MTECRVGPKAVALETTLLLHGVPREDALDLASSLFEIVESEGAEPALVGVIQGRPIVGITLDELSEMLEDGPVDKVNTANLGYALFSGQSGATTVATTMELAASAGVRFFATGGLGGVHRGYGKQWDVSADLAAFTRFPVAVVTSGAKLVLDVVSTREALETLGITVVGYGTDAFPAFYLRDSGARVDIRMDHIHTLSEFSKTEMERTGRGIVVANPIPASHEVSSHEWEGWFAEAVAQTSHARGRETTPALLGALHAISGGKTLRANLELVKSNARLAAQLAGSDGLLG